MSSHKKQKEKKVTKNLNMATFHEYYEKKISVPVSPYLYYKNKITHRIFSFLGESFVWIWENHDYSHISISNDICIKCLNYRRLM